jgi:hypothetical protein
MLRSQLEGELAHYSGAPRRCNAEEALARDANLCESGDETHEESKASSVVLQLVPEAAQ